VIHKSAIIEDDVEIGQNVEIGEFTIIRSGTHIGDNVSIGSHCEIGVPSPLASSKTLTIGEGSVIRSHSVFYTGSRFGQKLTTGHRATIRENVVAGNGLQVGTLSDIQGDCVIGEYVRFHSNVHIGKTSRIADCVWIFPYVVLTNDPHPPSEILTGPTLEKRAIVATGSVVLPGVTVGEDALVGAGAVVKDDVPARQIYVGNPGKVVGDVTRIRHKATGKPAYPWYNHYRKGYPEGLLPPVEDQE